MPPIIPVMTPTGSSSGAINVLAIVSHITKKAPPRIKDEGRSILWSLPTIIRIKWGTTRPTKPIEKEDIDESITDENDSIGKKPK